MTNDPFNIPYLRNHMVRHGAVPLTASAGQHATFFRDKSGKVFTDRAGMDLSRSTRCNDVDRRAWCGLAGVKLTDLRAQIKSQRELLEAERNADAESHAIRVLESRGYRVTKRRKA